MADGGGIIVDDAGATETRIWQHGPKLHERVEMKSLKGSPPTQFTINSVQLRGYILKVAGQLLFGPISKSAIVTATGGGVTLNLTIQNDSVNVTIGADKTLNETQGEPSIYRLLDVSLTSIKIDGVSMPVGGQHTTLLLEFS